MNQLLFWLYVVPAFATFFTIAASYALSNALQEAGKEHFRRKPSTVLGVAAFLAVIPVLNIYILIKVLYQNVTGFFYFRRLLKKILLEQEAAAPEIERTVRGTAGGFLDTQAVWEEASKDLEKSRQRRAEHGLL